MTDDTTPKEGATTRQDSVPVPEAAQRLNVTPDAIRARLRRGTLEGEKRGGAWYVILPAVTNDRTQPGETVATDPSRDATGTALVELVADLTRKNAELAGAAAVWQSRAAHLEERLHALEAGPIAAQDASGSSESVDTVAHGSGVGQGDTTPTGTQHDATGGFLGWLRRLISG